MGSVTLLDLEMDVLNRLGENFNSTLGDLATGTGGPVTIATLTPSGSSTASTIKSLLNEEAALIARTCYPVPETGTMIWTAGTRTNLVSVFKPGTSGQVMWAVRGAQYNAAPLKWASRSDLEIQTSGWMASATGSATYWYEDGPTSIGVATSSPVGAPAGLTYAYSDLAIGSSSNTHVTSGTRPFTSVDIGRHLTVTAGTNFTVGDYIVTDVASNVATLNSAVGVVNATGGSGVLQDGVKIDGYAIPKPLAAYSDQLAWIPDDLTHLLVWGVCVKLALKNFEDPSVYSRAADWKALNDKERMGLWMKIPASIRRVHFPSAPSLS